MFLARSSRCGISFNRIAIKLAAAAEVNDMLAFTLRFKTRRYLATLAGALVIIAGLTSQHAGGNGLPQINGKALAALAKQHPVVVLFRHAERCDRSVILPVGQHGITVNGA